MAGSEILFFLRSIPADYLSGGTAPAATPEHGQMSLNKKYFPRILMGLRDDDPLQDPLLERYSTNDVRVSAAAPLAA